MIYEQVTEQSFIDAFRRAGRGDQFSYDGLVALFEWLDELSEIENIKLDVISICCDFSEYSRADIKKEYPDLLDEAEDWDDMDIDEMGQLFADEHSATLIATTDDSVIIQD